MKLACLDDITLSEFQVLVEDDAPIWSFNYDKGHDKHPNILLLGKYQNSSSGNDLLGGINLNYLSKKQKTHLRKIIPSIMKAGNLYGRYHRGLRLAPDIFNNFYRTYNPEYISQTKSSVVKQTPPSTIKQPAVQPQQPTLYEPKQPVPAAPQTDILHPLPLPGAMSTNLPPQPPPLTPAAVAPQASPQDVDFPSDLDSLETRLNSALANLDATEEPLPEFDMQNDTSTVQNREPQNTGDEVDNLTDEVAAEYQQLAADDEYAAESISYYSPLVGGMVIEPAFGFLHVL